MNNMQKAFKKKGACGLADGGRPHMFAAQRRGMADGGEPWKYVFDTIKQGMADGGGPKRKPHGGEVEGPGGPTDDEAGEYALSDDEYVLPADTVEALGGAEVLDKIRDATHEFVDERNRPGLANGGPPEPNWFQKQGAIADTERRAAAEVKAGTANPDMQALYAKNQAALHTSAVMNPLAEVPGIGLASRTVSAGVAKAPGIVGGALEGLRAGANKVTNFFANKAASALPTTKVLPGTMSNGFTNAERLAATPAGYATGGLAQPTASVASKLASGQMPTAGRIAANAVTTGVLSSSDAPAAQRDAYAPGAGLPSATQIASDKARAAESALPQGLRSAQGGLSTDGLNASRFSADNDALLREQGSRVDRVMQSHADAGAGGRRDFQQASDDLYAAAGQGGMAPTHSNNPWGSEENKSAARDYYARRESEQFSPEMVGIVNKGIRARQNTPSNVATDNARFASDGHGDVTKSVGKDGRVSYGDSSPNPFLGSKFSNGQTGQQNLDTRRKNDATNLQEGLARAVKDRDTLDAMVQDRVARDTGFEKGAAAEAALRLEQSKVAGTERIGLAKARADMVKAQADMAKAGQDQKNSDRTFGLAQRTARREDDKAGVENYTRALEGKLGKQFDKDGNLSEPWKKTEAALRNTLQDRTNPDGTQMTVATMPDQDIEKLTTTLGLSQKGELKNWRKTLNWLMGDSKPASNEIESGLRPVKNSWKKSALGGYTWKDQDGREYFSDDLTYDEQIALGIRPERAQ